MSSAYCFSNIYVEYSIVYLSSARTTLAIALRIQLRSNEYSEHNLCAYLSLSLSL